MCINIVSFLRPFMLESPDRTSKIYENLEYTQSYYAVLHISNKNTAYFFEIRSYIKYFEARNPLCGIKGSSFD